MFYVILLLCSGLLIMTSSVGKWLNTREKNVMAYMKDLWLTLKCRKMLPSMPGCIFNILYFASCFVTAYVKKKYFQRIRWNQSGEQVFLIFQYRGIVCISLIYSNLLDWSV